MPAPNSRRPSEPDSSHSSPIAGSTRLPPDGPCSAEPAAYGAAFLKALGGQKLSQAERSTLTTDELFVLLLARRLDCLTNRERQALGRADLRYLAAAGLISGVTDEQTLRDE